MARLPESVRSATRVFAFFVGNGTLGAELLGDIDYRKHLLDYGSDLEMLVAVYTNVLDVDEDGIVTNEAHATRRAAQWLRAYCDPDFVVEPPFMEWETELV